MVRRAVYERSSVNKPVPCVPFFVLCSNLKFASEQNVIVQLPQLLVGASEKHAAV